jgi:shikimate dehydrogenase
VVNCTSVGLDLAESADPLALLGLEGLDPPETVVDLVYAGASTPVQRWALAGGSRFVDGLEVLVHQGALSLERWTGVPAPLGTMRAAARANGDD